MRFWAGLGFSTGLAGVALLSACWTKELLAPTFAVFTAPQIDWRSTAPSRSTRPVISIFFTSLIGASFGSPNDSTILRVRALAHHEFWIDRHSHRAGFKRRHRRYEA